MEGDREAVQSGEMFSRTMTMTNDERGTLRMFVLFKRKLLLGVMIRAKFMVSMQEFQVN